MQKRSRTINGIWTAVLTVLSLAWIYPIVMVVINSFKVESAISTSTKIFRFIKGEDAMPEGTHHRCFRAVSSSGTRIVSS